MTHPFTVMAKPIGPRCNIDCTYCYYLEKAKLYPDTGKFRMSDEVLARYIESYIAAQVAAGLRDITFYWQVGEPTILGIDYFRRILALQQAARPVGVTIFNALQTNGTLIEPRLGRLPWRERVLVRPVGPIWTRAIAEPGIGENGPGGPPFTMAWTGPAHWCCPGSKPNS